MTGAPLQLRARRATRALIRRFRKWLEYIEEEWLGASAPAGTCFDVATAGEVSYDLDMAFVEGQTFQDILAAACASTAIYVVRGRNVGPLAEGTVKHGIYSVSTHVTIEFEAIPEDGSYVPVFDGAKLTELITANQRR